LTDWPRKNFHRFTSSWFLPKPNQMRGTRHV
jgi:hypothetical protein